MKKFILRNFHVLLTVGIWVINILLVLLILTSQAKAQTPAYKALEVSFVSLNVADFITTDYGLRHGAIEANPLFKSNQNRMLMATVKLASTSTVLLLGRKLYKQNKKAATVTMVTMNIFAAIVLTNNVSICIILK